jgi:hypothetical protein
VTGKIGQTTLRELVEIVELKAGGYRYSEISRVESAHGGPGDTIGVSVKATGGLSLHFQTILLADCV